MTSTLRCPVVVVYICVLIAGLAALAGCESTPRSRTRRVPTTLSRMQINPLELRNDLKRYLEDAHGELIGVTSDIAAKSKDRRVRENTLNAKLRVSNAIEVIALEPDPRVAFFLAWASVARSRLYYTEGRGRAAFGEFQKDYVKVNKDLTEQLEYIGREHFGKDFDEARDDIDRLVRGGELTTSPLGEAWTIILTDNTRASSNVVDLLTMPMAPVRGLQGVGDTPDAINRFSVVAGGFTRIVRDLPERIRWQTELLMLEFEERETVIATRKGISDMSKSSAEFVKQTERFVDLAEKLPDKLQEKVKISFDELDKKQADLQKTIADAQKLVDNSNKLVEQSKPLAESMEQTSQAMASAGTAWKGMFSEVNSLVEGFREKKGQEPDRKKFDILEWERTATSLTASAIELQKLLVEVRELTGEESLTAVNTKAMQTVEYSAMQAADVTDHLAWRLGQLGLFFFVIVLVYRLITAKIAPEAAKPAKSD